jgi:hypothetical protein
MCTTPHHVPPTGTAHEKAAVKEQFSHLSYHIEATNRQYVVLDLLNTYIMKYGGQMVGFSVLIPRE